MIPTGRTELLQWVNALCHTQYPNVESLRDGVVYMSIVEASLARLQETEPTTTSDTVVDRPFFHQMLSQTIHKFDFSVTSSILLPTANHNLRGRKQQQEEVGSKKSDEDSIQTRARCEMNFRLLSELCERCIPKKVLLFPKLHVPRLAKGAMGDHLSLLQWCYRLVKETVSYAHSHHAQRGEEVEEEEWEGQPPRERGRTVSTKDDRNGPRANRAASAGTSARGRSRSREATGAATPRGGSSKAPPPKRSSSAHHDRQKTSTAQQQQSQPTTASSLLLNSNNINTKRNKNYTATNNSSTDSSYDAEAYRAAIQSHHHHQYSSSHLHTAAATLDEHRDDAQLDYQTGPQQSHRSELEELEAQLQRLESNVWARVTTSTTTTSTTTSVDAAATTLTDIESLVQERDVLWQTLTALEAAVWVARQQHEGAEDDGVEDGVRRVKSVEAPCALLEELCDVFHVVV